MKDFKQTRRLIRLKRYEQPPRGYHDDFLNEFRERQRSELLRRSSMQLFVERLAAFTSDMGKSRWLIGGALAYGLVALIMMADQAEEAEVEQVRTLMSEPMTQVNVSPLLNPQINLIDDLVPVLDQGDMLLLPPDYTAEPPATRVNGVLIAP